MDLGRRSSNFLEGKTLFFCQKNPYFIRVNCDSLTRLQTGVIVFLFLPLFCLFLYFLGRLL